MTRLARILFLPIVLLGLVAAPRAEMPGQGVVAALRTLAQPLRDAGDLIPLETAIGDARLVLLGESSHGTQAFYRWRALLSQRLIRQGGVSFIAIEGDWSALVPLDHYVRHHPDAPASARDALLQIGRWPRWVWVNGELEALGEWLRAFNRGRPPARRVGIHGIDLYAIWESLDALLAFYRAHLPALAGRVQRSLDPLEGFRGDYRGYSGHVRRGGDRAAAGASWAVQDLDRRYRAAGPVDREPLFETLQHARVVESGERYLARREPHGWNTRADHFARTVARLLDHYGTASRGIVWAHNTHIGDARATEMAHAGEVNLGQLARQRHGAAAVFAVGMATGTGTVSAARRWEGARHTLETPPPRPDSLEAALLAAGGGDRLLILDRALPATRALRRPLPHRAIGVVFDPGLEPWKNYIVTLLPDRYDAFVFLPRTTAIMPLETE
jgi:erythromycin esterase-like protein